MTSMDAGRTAKARKTKADEKRSIKRVKRSPSQISRPFTRRYIPPRFNYRPRDDYFSRRPSFGLRLQRYPRTYNLRFPSRPQKHVLRHNVRPDSPALSQRSEKWSEKRTSKSAQDKKSITPDRSRSSSVGSEKRFLSFTVPQEEEISGGRDALSSVTRAAARRRAIQRKREEIEEVYRQDCDTFGVVVKMLVAKDPSLETSIQSSLKENLREIGQRCVEAMEAFIHEYDSRELSTSQSQIH